MNLPEFAEEAKRIFSEQAYLLTQQPKKVQGMIFLEGGMLYSTGNNTYTPRQFSEEGLLLTYDDDFAPWDIGAEDIEPVPEDERRDIVLKDTIRLVALGWCRNQYRAYFKTEKDTYIGVTFLDFAKNAPVSLLIYRHIEDMEMPWFAKDDDKLTNVNINPTRTRLTQRTDGDFDNKTDAPENYYSQIRARMESLSEETEARISVSLHKGCDCESYEDHDNNKRKVKQIVGGRHVVKEKPSCDIYWDGTIIFGNMPSSSLSSEFQQPNRTIEDVENILFALYEEVNQESAQGMPLTLQFTPTDQEAGDLGVSR